jgi:sulfate/thiosulfate transport system substrate-binding protein
MRNARKVTRRRSVNAALLAALFALAAVVAGCGSSSSDSSSSSGGGKLDVVGYSTPESVYQEVLEPAFQKTSAGKGISFSNSFGASGDQSRAVVAGQPASVVHFSQAGDMERLVEEGELVSKDWEKQPYGGIATDSLVVILVKKGNPLGIKSFKDLETNEDAEVVTPNPFSSGSARWNIMAIYGSALLTYENEAIKAEKEGEDVEYVIPSATLQIETPIAVTEKAAEPAAEDFLKFLWSNEGQELWAENGYRPVNPKLVDPKQFPTPETLFKISKFGGWGKVNDEFFDEETGSVAKIEGELGVSTSG